MRHESMLAQLAAYRDAVEATALDPDAEPPQPPELPDGLVLSVGDIETAKALLAEVEATTARLTGLHGRVGGELAGLRRPSRSSRRRAPRNLDTAI